MGYYLQIDTDDPAPLASNNGWGDVIKWAAKLPAARASAINHLCQFGWQDSVTLLKIELEECLKDSPPKDPQTQATVKNFIALLVSHKDKDGKDKAKVVSVTDGLGYSE